MTMTRKEIEALAKRLDAIKISGIRANFNVLGSRPLDVANQSVVDAAVACRALLAALDDLDAVKAELREAAMQSLASLGQAQEAYEAQKAAEAANAALTARVPELEKAAWLEGLRNAAETVRSFRATEGVLHQPTLDLTASLLDGIAARAAISADAAKG